MRLESDEEVYSVNYKVKAENSPNFSGFHERMLQ